MGGDKDVSKKKSSLGHHRQYSGKHQNPTTDALINWTFCRSTGVDTKSSLLYLRKNFFFISEKTNIHQAGVTLHAWVKLDTQLNWGGFQYTSLTIDSRQSKLSMLHSYQILCSTVFDLSTKTKRDRLLILPFCVCLTTKKDDYKRRCNGYSFSNLEISWWRNWHKSCSRCQPLLSYSFSCLLHLHLCFQVHKHQDHIPLTQEILTLIPWMRDFWVCEILGLQDSNELSSIYFNRKLFQWVGLFFIV